MKKVFSRKIADKLAKIIEIYYTKFYDMIQFTLGNCKNYEI